jgi:glutaconate CoA-transferase subunit A
MTRLASPPSSQPVFESLAALASRVQSGDRLGIGGFHFSRAPIALARAVIEAGVRDLDFISWGGGLILEWLLAADAVRSMTLCFDNLDVFGLAPQFRAAVESGRVPLSEWTALGMIQGFQAARDGLESMPFPPPHGSDIVQRSGFARLHPDPWSGREVATVPALPLDVLLLHAQRADGAGNVEIQGARGLDLSSIFASRQVLATVEEIVPTGTLQDASSLRSYVVPRSFVTAISEVPYGAWPTSCLPFYPSDYAALHRIVDGEPVPEVPDDIRQIWLAAAATISPEQVTSRDLVNLAGLEPEAGPATPAEIMINWIASTIDNDSVCSVGSVSPLATVAYLLAKRTHAPALVLMTANGGLIDVANRPMMMILAESLDFQTAVLHCGGDDSYRWYYQRGRVTHEVVSAAQIDRWGGTNNIEVTSPSGRRIRLPGQGGMADVANLHRHFMLYLPRHSPLSLVERVDYVSAARGLLRDDERRDSGYQPGDVYLITNLAVFRLDPEPGEFVLQSLHSGVTLDHVREQTGFSPRVSPNLSETTLPSPETLRLIREEIDPLGMRELEFVAGKERGPLLARIIAAEERVISGLQRRPETTARGPDTFSDRQQSNNREHG